MRDPKRIPRIAIKLVRVWRKQPDIRLGQLIVNLTGKSDPFYVEDHELEVLLDVELDRERDPGRYHRHRVAEETQDPEFRMAYERAFTRLRRWQEQQGSE